MSEERPRFILPFALFAAILAVSTASIFIRFAQESAPSLVIAALRLAFATLLLAPLVLTRHRAELRSLTRQQIVFGVISGLFLAVHFASWITSLEYTTVASSVVFVATGPLWVALLSPMLLNERLTRIAVAGLIVAFLGGTIIGLSDACTWNGGFHCPDLAQVLHGSAVPSRTDVLVARTVWGNFLALVGAWAVSGYLIMGRKLRANMSLVPYIFLVYGIAAIGLLAVVLILYKNPFQYSAPAYLWIFLLALIPQLIGHSTFNWLLKYLSATMVAVTTLAEPVGSTILAYFLLHEIPSATVVVGGALILIGIYLTSMQGGKT